MPRQDMVVVVVLVMLGVVSLSRLGSRSAEVQQRIAPRLAEPWMLEALPGIGPVTSPAWTRRVQIEGITCLPAGMRPMARDLFRD